MNFAATRAIKQSLNNLARSAIQAGARIQGDATITKVQLVDHNRFNVWVDTRGYGRRCFEISIKKRF